MVLALVGAWGLVTVAAAMWFVARVGERGDLPRNGLVGIRTSTTRASDRAWAAGHRAAAGPARTLARVVVGLAVALAVSALLPQGEQPHPVTVGLFALGYSAVLLGALLVTRTASRAARDA
ncbi:SdpI family protein [Nocardioides lacusdianchii]|uniref:SdpI family protein n=1 Tax=Nocardioides lacusdianchii TaxID=2783664 RepID=UPI001CCAFAFA|nr:SdpI family protein [Nocardioides lacusdianchii]